MPVKYIVGDRSARPFTRWGFTLPPPRPVGPLPPIYLPGVGSSFAEAQMEDGVIGYGNAETVMSLNLEKKSYLRFSPLPSDARGVWTGGISDCVVVCGAYYERAKGLWGMFWFEHISGGQYKRIVKSMKLDLDEQDTNCPNVTDRWAVVAAGYELGTSEIIAKLIKIGFLDNNISLYISGTSTHGFGFGVDFSTGLFGETTSQGGVLPSNLAY